MHRRQAQQQQQRSLLFTLHYKYIARELFAQINVIQSLYVRVETL